MLVAGEAGAGKTVLLRDFCARYTDARPVGELRRAVHGVPARPLIEMVTEGGLADELVAGAAAHTVASALLTELSRPAIVVFEDVHWADEATLDVLRLLGRRIATVPALVVVDLPRRRARPRPTRCA